jgi:hypothetical protein
MSVVTLFFCGTCSSRNDKDSGVGGYDNGELVSRLGERCTGTEGETKFTIDGPGSGNQQEDWKIRGKTNYWTSTGTAQGSGWDENVMFAIDVLLGRVNRDLISPPAGARWWDDVLFTACRACKKKFSGFLRSGKHHCRLCGHVFCDNCTKNRLSIKAPLSSNGRLAGEHQGQRVCDTCFNKKFREFHRDQDRERAAGISRINCIGWSRGGVTTHMFANACAEEPLLRGKEIRLIAVDPVPGGSEMASHRVAIKNDNIRQYVAFFARNERSRCFSPTLPQINAGGCPLKIYFFPGNHSSLVGNSGGDNILYNSAVLVRHIAETHLKEWGTRFTKSMQLSDIEVLRYYDFLVKHRRHFEKLNKFSILGGGTRLGPTQNGRWMMVPGNPQETGGANANFVKMSVMDPDALNECFVNWHHMECAEKRFPNCVKLIKGEQFSETQAANELTMLRDHMHLLNLAAQVERRLRQLPDKTSLPGFMINPFPPRWKPS